MEKYLVTLNPPSEEPNSAKRSQWKRDLVEINGKLGQIYRHHASTLIIQSYSEVGALPHRYHVNGEQCLTHVDLFIDPYDHPGQTGRQGISSLEFDSKGVYLASVTKSGCLTVHDFDNLQSPEDEAKQLLHISTRRQLDVVRWNHANQEEIASSSMKSSEVHIYDIGYISDEPTEVLKKRPNITVHGFNVHKGVTDVAFFYNNNSRMLASDTDGVINIWDRRVSHFPCFELTTNSLGSLNSVRISWDNEIIYGANQHGIIFLWDLRGGKSYTTFKNHKEEKYSPFMAVKLEVELEKIQSLKAQSNIVSKEIHSIDFDPSCSYQLAFHLDDGWSGVLDTKTCEVTHIHCPPPPWLDEPDVFGSIASLRKPCWLPFNSIYAAGSSSSNGLYLLDFYPARNSSCHVDCTDDMDRSDKEIMHHNRNRYLPLSEGVTACVSHPLNGTIVAGTRLSTLLLISQPKMPC